MKPDCDQQMPRQLRQSHRPAFTLIELTMVTMLLAIAAAVVIPRWNQTLERTKVAGLQRAVEADIAYLCRNSVRRGQPTTLTFTAGTASLHIAPALPGILGDSSGLVQYGERFPGLMISQANFDGSNQFQINHFGEPINASNGTRLSVGQLTFRGGTTSRTSDVLLAHGTPSP